MTSIMTNTAAMTALQTLQSTNNLLESTQNRISTGYRVSEASDNAAYWSIATTMRSDNKAMSSVQDSLGMGAATVDTAYTGMTAVKDVLDEIKAKLTTATGENIDRAKVQSEITQLQDQLKSIADSASFSGENWLSVNGTSMKSIVSSFARNESGAVSLGSIQINTSKTALFDAGAGDGLLDVTSSTAAEFTAVDTAFTASFTTNAGSGGAALDTGIDPVDPADDTAATSGTFETTPGEAATFTLKGNDVITFDVTVDSGDAQQVTISKSTIDQALSSTDGIVDSAEDYGRVLEQALNDANLSGVTVSRDAGTSAVTVTSGTTGTTSTVAFGNVEASAGPNVMEIDLTKSGVTSEDIQNYIKTVDSALEQVTSAAADLGATKTRIDMQSDFVGDLMNAIDRGVGTLVDADMTEESTMLKALQTQQQLGVQALSIANQSSQALLTLFR